MPHILLPYAPSFAKPGDQILTDVKDALKKAAARELSTSELTLTEKDFFVKCMPAEPDDDMPKDFLVLIFVHGFEERLEDPDGRAERISDDIREQLEVQLFVAFKKLDFSVSLFFGQLGYHADSAVPATLRAH